MPARVFVLTLSGRDEAARRELIRGSWGTRGSLPPTRGSDFDVGHAFFVGNRTCLLPEAARQYDIDCSSQSAGQPEREQSALRSKKPVRLINAPEAFVRAGDGKACIRKPEALVCCHGSMGPRNMQRCGNSSWTAMPAVEAEMSALPQCRSKLPAPLDSRCRLGSGGEGSRGPRGV